MLYKNRKPIVITIDDYFSSVDGYHAFVKIIDKDQSHIESPHNKKTEI